MPTWISGRQAATILGVSESTVLRSLTDDHRRTRWWGDQGAGWRHKPLSTRKIFQVDAARAQQLAAGQYDTTG